MCFIIKVLIMKKGRMAKSKHRQIKRVRALVSDPRDMIVHVRGGKKF